MGGKKEAKEGAGVGVVEKETMGSGKERVWYNKGKRALGEWGPMAFMVLGMAAWLRIAACGLPRDDRTDTKETLGERARERRVSV